MAHEVDPEAVIAGLAAQVGQLTTQVIMRDVLLAEAQKRVAELEAAPTAADAAAPGGGGA